MILTKYLLNQLKEKATKKKGKLLKIINLLQMTIEMLFLNGDWSIDSNYVLLRFWQNLGR